MRLSRHPFSMLLSEEDIDEFIALAKKEGVELTREEATATATRLVLLYLRLAMPTPSEMAERRLAKTRADACVGEEDGITAWHPARLARNSVDGGRVIYLLDSGKLKDLKFATYTFENTPQGKFMLQIVFANSKYYVDSLSENVKREIG